MKICSRCTLEKAESEFSVARTYRGGLNAQCIACRRKTALESYYRHRLKIREKQHEKYHDDLEESRRKSCAFARKYYSQNPDRARKNSREWYEKHKEELREKNCEKSRRYRADGRVNIKAVRESQRRYIERNKDKVAASKRAYVERYPERVRMTMAANKARRRAAEVGELTARQWKEILFFYGNACALCRIPASEVPMSVDHFIPISKGGIHDWKNVWPLCMPCNMKKRDKMPDELYLPHVAVFKKTGTRD